MKKRFLALVAVVLSLCLSLSGCGALDLLTDSSFLEGGILGYLGDEEWVNFQDMEYTRPDMENHDAVLEESCRLAAEAERVEEIIDGVYAYYDVYDRVYTDYFLADIHYSQDLTDGYWAEEYDYASGCAAQADAGLDRLYRALAASPYLEELEKDEYFGEGYFDSYQGKEISDPVYTAFLEQEAQLESRYYDLVNQADSAEYYSEEYFSTYGIQMEQLYVELVALRQQMAAHLGFDSYSDYAYQVCHGRDYTPQQDREYLAQIGTTLSDLYRRQTQSDVWARAGEYSSELATFQYLEEATQAMGGDIWEAFQMMEQAQLYDITYSPNKYDASFESYLWSYGEPFIFLSPYLDHSDKLSFAHEFGHFLNDYLCWGSYVGTDVSEVQSQAMEYLTLCYGDPDGLLEDYKLLDCLSTYVEQASYALFELEVYALEGEELTVENVRAINQRIGDAFGMDAWGFDCRDYVVISHYFTDPMYISSYVVSNDLALQIYQLEKEQPGKGLEIYRNCAESMDSYIVAFAETYGLESPFAPGRLETVKHTLEEGLR